MNRNWRNPVLPVGFVLLVLGLGNWVVSCNRIAEYAPRAHAVAAAGQNDSLADFPELTPRTNTTLLKRLNRGVGDYTFVDAKLEFYEIVHSGGRLLAALGLLLIAVGLTQSWRRHDPLSQES